MKVRKYMQVIALHLAIVGCNRAEPTNNQAAIADGNLDVVGSVPAKNEGADSAGAAEGETPGTFLSFERGDHLYAMFDLPAGREAESTALIRDVELAAFLNAHRGKPLKLLIETRNERLDPPGENMDVTSLVTARSATQTFQQWWQSLSPERQTAARTEIENLPMPGGG